MRTITLMIMMCISLLIISGCSQNQVTVEHRPAETGHVETEHVDTTQEIKTAEGDVIGEISIEADVEQVLDCPEQGCFEEKFAACEPATVTIKLMDTLIYHYEIDGPAEGMCSVTSKFLANFNPEWVGKPMTCNYDHSKSFEDSTKEVIESFNTEQHLGDCEGELYLLMTGQ